MHLVAQEINFCTARNGFALLSSDLQELIAIRLINSVKFLESLVAGNHKQVVFALQYGRELITAFQLVLRIIFQLLTFLMMIICLNIAYNVFFIQF